MAIVTVSVHGEILDPDTSLPAVGTVTFRNLTELRDTVTNIVYEPGVWTVTLDVLGEFTVVLPATDSPDITPTGWLYQVYISTSHWRDTFFISLPTTLAPAVEFADLIPIQPDDGSGCTPDGTACAPISLVAEVEALAEEVAELAELVGTFAADIAALQVDVGDLQSDVAAIDATLSALITNVGIIASDVSTLQGDMTVVQGQITTINGQIVTIQGQITTIQGQITTLQGQVAANTANITTNTTNITTLQGQVATIQGQITTLQGQVATLQGQILAINAAWITSGTLPYQRLGGTIAELDTVTFNRATLVSPGTAADSWTFTYNGVRVLYANEYMCLRVRGIPDNQVPARIMSNLARDGTTLASFQVSLSDAATHLFQVLANGDILSTGGLSMLPSAPVVVGFTAPAGNAALISDGTGTGAPYALTTTLQASNNRVYFDGAVANNGGAIITGGTVLFTVTLAHRPTAWVQCNERTSTTLSARVTVRPDGTVRLDQPLAIGATVSLDGFNYRKS